MIPSAPESETCGLWGAHGMVRVNPLHTKRIKEVNDKCPLETDDKDSRVIAGVLRLGHALSVDVPEGDAAYLRRLNTARERHVRDWIGRGRMK